MRGGLVLIGLILCSTLWAGQPTWQPGAEVPRLTLKLGDGPIRQSYSLPPGASRLDLVLVAGMAEERDFWITWTADGQRWSHSFKKIPGDAVTLRVELPPGRSVTLEVTTVGGTPLASIKLPRK